jgi:hypothetical protein
MSAAIARSNFSSSNAARRARLMEFVVAAPLRLSSVVRTWAGGAVLQAVNPRIVLLRACFCSLTL